MSNSNKESKFVYPFGPKKSGANAFNPKMDTTDQRAPVNDIQELYNTFMLDDDIQDELDNENVDDFDSDVFDYDDRSEFGVDVAMSQQADVAKAAGRLAKRKK